MKTHVLKGSKQEIAESLVRLSGEVREAIVLEDEPTPAATYNTEDIFAEMGPFTVDVQKVDYSRKLIR